MPHYTTNTLKIVFESFDTEVVLVNLDSGHYYVLASTAGTIWQLLVAGLSPTQIGDALTKRYNSTAGEIALAAQLFADELMQDNLLLEDEKPVAPLHVPLLAKLETATLKIAFESPSMFKYTEMENLIQMDPIREVDETGWPERRKFPKKGK